MKGSEQAVRRGAATGAAVLIAAILPACGKRTVASGDPAQACASQQTTERIRDLVFEKAANAAGSTNRYAVPKLRTQSEVSVSRPLVESYDAGTHKANCTGVLAVKLPAGVMTVGSLRVPIRYSAQPLADNSGLSFDLSGADEVVAAIAGADLTVWAKANAPAPEPGLVVEVANAPGSGTKVARADPPRSPPVSSAEAPDVITTPLPSPPPPARRAPAPKPATMPAAPPPAVPRAPEPRAAIAPKPSPRPAPPPAKPAVIATRPPVPEAPRQPVRPLPPSEPRAQRPPPRRPTPPVEVARREPRPIPEPRLRDAPPLRPDPPLRQARAPVPPPLPASGDGPVRVFVHVAGGTGRGEADAVRARLGDLLIRGAPVATPGVRTVARTPRRNEVRCLKAADCVEARRVAAYLARSLPGGVTVVDMSRTYENDPGVRRGSLELWLKPSGAPQRSPYGDEDDE